MSQLPEKENLWNSGRKMGSETDLEYIVSKVSLPKLLEFYRKIQKSYEAVAVTKLPVDIRDLNLLNKYVCKIENQNRQSTPIKLDELKTHVFHFLSWLIIVKDCIKEIDTELSEDLKKYYI